VNHPQLSKDSIMKPSLLSDKEKEAIKKRLKKWKVSDESLEREFVFVNFKQAFIFMTKIAFAAEARNHHPDWRNIYNKVIIRLSTHDLGGISTLDIEFAKEIDEISSE